MSDQDSDHKPAHSPIADAIRAKRDRRTTLSVGEELEALEASLLADIESFDLDATARQVLAQEQQVRGTGLVTEVNMNFPHIVGEGVEQGLKAPEVPQPPLEVKEDGLHLNSGGLLEQLRHEVERRQHQDEVDQGKLSQLEGVLDQALHQVFAYLHELVQQLNVIKPPIPRIYPVVGEQELKGLVWQEGFCDFRTRPQSAGATMEFVSFNYRLAGGQHLVMERDGTVAESFRHRLFDLNLNVKVDEFRNERRYLERARFTVAPEVRVSTRWEADYQTGKLLITTRNLERLGSSRYTLSPEEVSQAMLDEFGRLILGQPHQFPKLLSR